jgi:transcriptional regulator with XRE-family HTH domain
MDYGKAIRVARTAYGLSQSELAEHLSIGTSQLSLIESGKRQPSVKVLEEISVLLHVPPHLLTLLASERKDLERAEDQRELSDLATALLKMLASAGEQRLLPLKPTDSKSKKSA